MALLAGQHVLVVDSETTGFDPNYGHRLIEVATVSIVEGALGEHWSSLVRPGRSIPSDATAVHGLSDAELREAPAPDVVAAELRRRCDDRVLVFHNVGFDLPFLTALLRETGQPRLLNPIVDTLGLSRELEEAGGHSLEILAARLELPPPSFHRALPDAVTTAHVFLALAARWEARGVRSLAELAALSQDALRSG
ncbi:MAG TPA: 3'-5' exonuclease [Candidatus Limnocylindria bacterium]|nr:3'-5' exonuclease [Candidatus Limnocylindria bacterium]